MSPEIAVIGGGVAGSLTAWALSLEGASVYVYDPLQGVTATSISAGIVDLTLPQNLLELGLQSLRIYRERFPESFRQATLYWIRRKSESLCYEKIDRILMHEGLLESIVWGRAYIDNSIINMKILDGENLAVIKSGIVDTGSLVSQALSSPRISLVSERVERVSCNSVITESGHYSYDYVVVATGPWTRIIKGLEPVRSILRTYTCESLVLQGSGEGIAVIDDSLDFYSSHHAGEIIAGNGCCRETENIKDWFTPDSGVVNSIVEKLVARVPSYENLALKQVRAAPCSVGADSMPLVGPVWWCDRLYLFTGLDGIGVTIAPPLALQISSSMLHGKQINRSVEVTRLLGFKGGKERIAEPVSLC